jgi:Zn-dependent protease
LVLFLISTLLLVLLAGLFWRWQVALMLLIAIGLHEGGHWLAMRQLGYRNLPMIVPAILGGVTLDRGESRNAEHPIFIHLMGPLPGILIGTIVLLLFGAQSGWISELGVVLLLVNYFNLLPIMPLDGGRLMQTLIPVKQLSVLIAVAWLGCASLLLISWLTDSLFFAAIALLPLLTGLSWLKRKQVLTALYKITKWSKQARKLDTATVIQAIDQSDRRYRPLIEKVWEISDILTSVRVKPITSKARQSFLAIYLAAILLPPIVVYANSPGIQVTTRQLFSDAKAIQLDAHERAMSLPLSKLLQELAERQTDSTELALNVGQPSATRPPANSNAIRRAETRLGTTLDRTHRRLLESSNGFIKQSSSANNADYLLFPIEQVKRFGEVLPEIVNRLQMERQNSAPLLLQLSSSSDPEKSAVESLSLNQVAHMLIIGRPDRNTFLLLDPIEAPDEPAALLLISISQGMLKGRRYTSLRHYVAHEFAMAHRSRGI